MPIKIPEQGKPCRVLSSDMRTKIAAANLYTYPDLLVVCGRSIFDAKDRHALVNPTVIVEVLSPSTEAYDRGEKFTHYKKLDLLQEYVLVSQHRVQVERYTRSDASEWSVTLYQSTGDTLELPSIHCRVSLREIYAKVDFETAESEDQG